MTKEVYESLSPKEKMMYDELAAFAKRMNEAVARKLGWRFDRTGHWHSLPKDGGGSCWDALPDYCHSIAAAWEIVEFVRESHGFSLEKVPYGGIPKWDCELYAFDMTEYKRNGKIQSQADTAPMAICLAFLKLEDK